MRLLRRFTAVGAVATVVDVGLLGLLHLHLGWAVAPADAVAVAAATAVSWSLHALVTLPDDPSTRWFRRVGRYAGAALAALAVDVAVVWLVDLVVAVDDWPTLLVAKVPALCVAALFRTANYRRAMFSDVRGDQQLTARRPPAPGGPRLSVVVPAYREADRIGATVARIRDDLADVGASGGLEVVVVDDGSGDATAAAAEAAGADRVVSYRPNRGKGAAVRAGVLAATGRTVAFTDADLAYAPDQLRLLMERVEQGWDVVVGSRQHTDTMTVVRAGRLREAGGRIVNVLTAIVLLGRYRDTQCGLKAMRSDAARLVFGRTVIDGFAFDVEVFHLVERYRLTLAEVPVEVVNSSRSTVHVIRDASRLVRDLFRIRRRAVDGGYELDPGELPESLQAGPPGADPGRGAEPAQH